MSFKREGDDPSQLNVLKKRRVADLLANYIPEDEALLLRDGRYACTVCFHRPVFDTLDMLTVHRSGKKHLISLQKFYGKKRSLESEVQKRRHQAYLQAEETGAQVSPGPAPLLVETRKIAHNALLKNVPYSSCCRHNRRRRRTCRCGYSCLICSCYCEVGRILRTPALSQVATEQGDATPKYQSLLTPESVKRSAALGKERSRKRKAPHSAAPHSDTGDVTPEKRRALEHYLRLKSSGWVQDGSGKWVKDENVEFDSDEEEPPALTPS
ncbi:sodium channel modifier 1 isoform X2 [Podarcis raffonei]|uniref:sodium channel modifier 1 isoform X2 n=1 Tax=Podarcis raffonei TaxID=65483 RepID=UPI002329743D|nr:sodium channel modifier 1 isoform X2 [Podarcis raffonei]